ncbi:trypsin-like serine peptidase [Nocardiopsis ansamitocini]|uniref:Peptidase n=1 Tax=Nocardiopsis ansamitocini TaxID=1670832 RepID=A0A9W6P3M9_9ACTN|nr:trypsin-like peptidase domain-containing protein [Nocardiopsis ansamitocini]GLU46497.1 peptidase [Nocardiopsis ansamitocini]
MTSSAAHKILGPLAGLTIAMVGVPADSTAPAAPVPEPAPQVAAAPAAPDAPEARAGSTSDAPGPAPARAAADGVVRQSAAVGEGAQEAVLDYWTPQRMASAVPRSLMLQDVVGALPLSLPIPVEEGSTPQAASANSTGERWTSGGAIVKRTGKVYLTLDGADFTCSAAVVNSRNKDTVITAAHCLKDGKGSWAKNWIFVPGYDDGKEPYGRYSAREMLVAPEWSKNADDSYDFGMAVLNTGSGGAHVADRTGSLPIGFSERVASRVYSFGYPSSGSFKGRHLYYCSGATARDQKGTEGAGMRCTMTQGSSGGPWLKDFATSTGTGTVTSVVSFKYANDSRTQYGPRLGDDAKRLYNAAQGL